MISKDLPAYATQEWGKFTAPVTELSRGCKGGSAPLVQHEKQLYNFDAICDDLFSRQKTKKPSSADAIDVSPRVVRLVEFKSGFRPKIGKENFVEERGACEATGQVCQEYWKLFSELRNVQTRELYDSLRAKAVESLFTLEKRVLPLCKDSSKPIRVFYVVVIDVDPTDKTVDILTALATPERTDHTSNFLGRIRNALSRLVNIQDDAGNSYCYDAVEVLSPQEYIDYLSRHT